MLHCPLQFCTTSLFISLMPFQWCHFEVILRNMGLSLSFWLAEAWPMVDLCGSWLSWEWAGMGRGFVSASVMQWNQYPHPPRHRSVLSASQRREEDSNAHTHSAAPILQLTATKWEGERWGEGGKGSWGGGGLRREDRAVKHFRARHSRVMKHSKRIYLCNIW